MSEWQPIETAPKDGTVIDVWVSGDAEWAICERVTDAYWRSEPFGYDGANGFDLPEGWAAPNRSYDGEEHWIADPRDGETVTHWMPIPSPPANPGSPTAPARAG